MKKLLLILLCLPMIGFGKDPLGDMQTNFLTADYKLLNAKSISEILLAAKENGYFPDEKQLGENLIKKEGFYNKIYLKRKVDFNLAWNQGPDTFFKTNGDYGQVVKEVFLLSDDLDNIVVWKVETIISLFPNFEYWTSSKQVVKRFDKTEKYLKDNLKKGKFKLIKQSEEFSKYKFSLVERNLYKKKKSNDFLIVLIGRRSEALDVTDNTYDINQLYFSTENSKYSYISDQELNSNKILEDMFVVNNQNIKDINTYDLKAMINFFLDDCAENKIKILNQKISSSFSEIDKSTLAFSSGLGNDSEIIIVVDPVNWNTAAKTKKWYIMYHELGHDVFNFEHGQAGKMMFNFADRDYTWKEFLIDKKYMFDVYKNKNQD